MTGARVEIGLDGGADAVEKLVLLGSRLDDLTPVFREIAGVLADETEQAFESESDPSTLTPWEQLAAATIAERTDEGYWPGKILQRTGSLAASVSTDYGADFAAVGTNKVQAALMQFGGQAGRGGSVTVPARPFLGVSEEGLDEVLDICGRYLLDG